MRSKYVKRDELDCVLMALSPMNKLACEVSLAVGLRIDDVLSIKISKLTTNRITVKEMKTGKTRRITIPRVLYERMLEVAGRYFVFEGRTDPKKHRTRQAVYKDIVRASKALRLGKGISPHSMRKVFAVRAYRACGNMKKVQELLNHNNVETTMLYALADELAKKNGKQA